LTIEILCNYDGILGTKEIIMKLSNFISG